MLSFCSYYKGGPVLVLQQWFIFFTNYGLAWIGVLLSLILSIKYITRKLSTPQNPLMKKWNRSLNRSHKFIGILLVLIGFIHGFTSSQSVFSLNIGTLSWVVSILLGVNFLLRKQMPRTSMWLAIHRFLTVLFLSLLLWHVIDVGGIGIFREAARIQNQGTSTSQSIAVSSTVTSPASSSTSSLAQQVNESINGNGAIFQDGTYTGVADGYGPNLTVSVTIQNNQITDITILSHNEKNQRFFGPPMSKIPAQIIEKQSLDVDTVAGATYTSKGIIHAVQDALSQALVSGEIASGWQ